MPRERVAACIIAENESERLPAALVSVSFCDEVIVVDGGSTDATVEIARGLGASVIENPWPGFARQRNVAIDAASCDWILEVDADERVSEELRLSIEALLADAGDAAIAAFPSRHRFLGAALGPSAKYPAYRTRLFRRDVYRHDESRAVHEGIEARARPVVLSGDLEHELAGTLGEALADLWRYSRLESEHIGETTVSACLTGIVLRPSAKFLYRTAIDGGWRDGWRGILRIALEVTSDAVVWGRVLARSRMRGRGGVEKRRAGHFGRRSRGAGKIVALAAGARARDAAIAWLTALRDAGLDVALVSDETPQGGPDTIPSRRARRLGPLATRRELEIEMDLRTIDAVVPFGGRARAAHRLLPPTLKPAIDGVDERCEPDRVVLLAASRDAGATSHEH